VAGQVRTVLDMNHIHAALKSGSLLHDGGAQRSIALELDQADLLRIFTGKVAAIVEVTATS